MTQPPGPSRPFRVMVPCFREAVFQLATSPAVLAFHGASRGRHSTLPASPPNLSCFYSLLLSFA